jgi:hypothetical protein
MNETRSTHDSFARPDGRRALLAPVVLGAVASAVFAVAACGGSAPGAAKAAESSRAETLQHEPCDTSAGKLETLDTNGDGKPDITRVLDKTSGKEICRIGDLNHDGKPEMYEYFDASGLIRRREFCYDDTGVVNGIERYEGGKLVSREFDAEGQHRIDTWDFFDTSVPPDPKTGRPAHPARRERDTTGDGHVNQWWTWNGSKITIAVDTTGDGKPDPESQIVIGGSGSDAPPPADTAASAAPATSSAPASSAAPAPSAAPDGGK